MSAPTTNPLSEGVIGSPVHRIQDDRLLRGNGRYVDDLHGADMLHAAIVRSQIASGEIIGFDASRALAVEGVLLVLGPKELQEGLQPIQQTWLLPGQQMTEVPLAESTVRFVGQPIGIVVATSRALAEDAAEMVEVDYDEREPVATVAAARAPGAPLVYPDQGSNAMGGTHFGDPAEGLEEVFATAAHVVDRSFRIPRVTHSSMETRGVVAEYIPATGVLEVFSSTHVPHQVRQDLGVALRMRVDKIRVVAPDVGGSFGQKISLFPDEAMTCLAAKTLGRRVKWIEDRTESMISAYQGHGQETRGRLALDEAGKFLALHLEIQGDIGAFPSGGAGGSGPFQVSALMIEGPYRFDQAGGTLTCWFTNTVPTGAIRGYGIMESLYVRERLIDEAARTLSVDPVELRLQNMLTSDELPFTTRCHSTYDNGDYPAALTKASAIAKTHERPSEGRIRRGVGLSCMVEMGGYGPSRMQEMFGIHWAGWDSSRIRVNEDGTVTVFSGVTSVGQGIETALAQIAAERLGVPIAWIDVQLGDTTTSPYSNMASMAARGLTNGGGALYRAASRLRDRMFGLAATFLDSAVADIEFDGENFRSAAGGTISWHDVAHRGWMGWGRDPDDPIALDELEEYDPKALTYSYGTHGAAVEVDLDTGKVTITGYWAVDDSGVIVNPLIAEGQIIGGIAQGIGAALLEEAAFADTGQPITTTYLDYLLPLSEDVPDIHREHIVSPSPTTPGGFKGLGESGIRPVAAALANAIAAAVPEIAEGLVSIPMSPSRIWTLLDEAGLTR